MLARTPDQLAEVVRPVETPALDEATPAWAEALRQDQQVWQDLLAENHLSADESLQLPSSGLRVDGDGESQRVDLTAIEFRDRLGMVERTLNPNERAGLEPTLDALYTMAAPASQPGGDVQTDVQKARAYWQNLLEQHVDVTLITTSLNALIKRAAANPQAIDSEWDFTDQLFATPENYQTWLGVFTQYKERVTNLSRNLGLGSTDVPLTDTELKIVALTLRLGIHNARAFAHLETTAQKVE